MINSRVQLISMPRGLIQMFNFLTHVLPTKYKGFNLNTSFRNALRAQEVLDDPRLINGSQEDIMAAYFAAISFIYEDPDAVIQKLGLDGALNGLTWWLSCGDNDKVEIYWRTNRVIPDIDSNSFSLDDYNKKSDDYIDVERLNPEGKRIVEHVTKYAILSFNAPDGTVRYAKETRGDQALLSLYEDNALIYSGFYKVFNIDLSLSDIHWFTFCALLAELEATEGTSLNNKIKLRAFDPDDYKGKAHSDYRNKMMKARHENRVLGILPYVDKGC